MNFDKRLIFEQTIPQNGLRAEKFGPLYLYVHSMPFNIFISMFYIRLSFFCNIVLFRTEARQQHSRWLVSSDPWHRRRLVELMGKIFIMWKTEINEGFECQAKCKTTLTAFYKRIFFERNCFCHRRRQWDTQQRESPVKKIKNKTGVCESTVRRIILFLGICQPRKAIPKLVGSLCVML